MRLLGETPQEDVYYDTTEDDFLLTGGSLRVRRRGERRVLTLKTPVGQTPQTGAFARREEELELSSDALPAGFLRERLPELDPDALRPAAQVENLRRTYEVKGPAGCRFELAFDDVIFRDALAAANETLYDFDLMSGGGHVRGLRVAGMDADALAARLCVTGVGTDSAHPMRFAIADGNHSLAAARLCWLEKKQSLTPEQAAVDPARYALVELVNLHSPAVTFEPIHRVLFGTDASKWMQTAEAALASADGSGYAISLIAGSERRDILAKGASLGEAIAAMDTFCAAYLAESGGTVDYIHGDDEALELAAGDGCCGILMPRMDKAELFTSVLRSGPFPKKSFSIGLGADKRYYLECRKL